MFDVCPVYFRGKTEEYSFEDLLKTTLADHPQETLCANQPQRCRKDISFVIHTSRVKVQDLPFSLSYYRKSRSYALNSKKVKERDHNRCWAKNSVIYLRKDEGSCAIKITNMDCLRRLGGET